MSYTIHLGSNLDILPTLPDNSVDSIVTDPPYGLSDNKYVADTIARWINGERDFIPDGKGFMGKAWDSFVPPPALWDECLRVLKPGGHLLAFFGSRTQDIGALSIRLAGFEIRDSIAWMYGSGFPKSLDISKAIDKGQGQNKDRQLQFVNWMRSTGLKQQQINTIIEKQDVGSHYLRLDQPAIATADLFDKLRPYLPDVPEEIERLVAERTGIEWTEYKNRKKTGTKFSGIANRKEKDRHTIGASKAVEVDITESHTPEAQQWEGWGTALKPAHEPIVVARKPLIGTVAETVLEHGTGGLNIDGSRIGISARDREVINNMGGFGTEGWVNTTSPAYNTNNPNNPLVRTEAKAHTEGRWPSNVILDPYTAELLDEQSGVSKSGSPNPLIQYGNGAITEGNSIYGHGLANDVPNVAPYGDSGGASRFFYVAKASKRDRNEGLEELEETTAAEMVEREPDSAGMNSPRAGAGRTSGAKNFHPTVKPTDLMRYLVKLVTPPGGVVLDPFTGSGSTGKAAILEGFDFIGIELTPEYLPIIEGRLKHAEAQRLKNETKEDEALF